MEKIQRLKKAGLTVFMALLLVTLASPVFALVGFGGNGDPTGAKIPAEKQLPLAIDATWLLLTGFLVFFMQVGFAMLEAGSCRTKNTGNILLKNLIDYCFGMIGFWAIGYALMFGADKAGFIGTTGFFLAGKYYDVETITMFFFQSVFMATSATIVSGAIAERTVFKAYCVYSFIISLIIYPLFGHWTWGGGWLWTLPFGSGYRDFAGSGVVHLIGGTISLAALILMGPRLGKYKKDGTPNAIPGHSITLVIMGTFFLFFGWFGFNPGSTFGATDLRIGIVAVTTALAGAAGALTSMFWTWWKFGKPDVTMTCNGCIAALVAITAPSAYVNTTAAVIIGALAGPLVVESVLFLERKGIDDAVGAVSCHATGGAFGLIALGIFADGTYGGVTGLLYGGGLGQLIAQLIGVATGFVWAFVTGFLLFWILKHTTGIRVSEEEEIRGLDISEHGMVAYPEWISVATGKRENEGGD